MHKKFWMMYIISSNIFFLSLQRTLPGSLVLSFTSWCHKTCETWRVIRLRCGEFPGVTDQEKNSTGILQWTLFWDPSITGEVQHARSQQRHGGPIRCPDYSKWSHKISMTADQFWVNTCSAACADTNTGDGMDNPFIGTWNRPLVLTRMFWGCDGSAVSLSGVTFAMKQN